MKIMKRNRRVYSKEFKANAVELILSGRSVSELSRDSGVHHSLLHRWKNQHLQELDGHHEGPGQSPSEMAAEIERLRKELAEQREINVILKKTIKFIS